MSAVRAAGRQAFSSLKVRNFRLYITAQLISVSGTWMQSVAQAWLILHLTDSGVALGALVGLQFLPMLLLGPVGGLLVDRWPKRRILFGTQAAGGVLGLPPPPLLRPCCRSPALLPPFFNRSLPPFFLVAFT